MALLSLNWRLDDIALSSGANQSQADKFSRWALSPRFLSLSQGFLNIQLVLPAAAQSPPSAKQEAKSGGALGGYDVNGELRRTNAHPRQRHQSF